MCLDIIIIITDSLVLQVFQSAPQMAHPGCKCWASIPPTSAMNSSLSSPPPLMAGCSALWMWTWATTPSWPPPQWRVCGASRQVNRMIGGSWAVSHWHFSANQNITVHFPSEKHVDVGSFIRYCAIPQHNSVAQNKPWCRMLCFSPEPTDPYISIIKKGKGHLWPASTNWHLWPASTNSVQSHSKQLAL